MPSGLGFCLPFFLFAGFILFVGAHPTGDNGDNNVSDYYDNLDSDISNFLDNALAPGSSDLYSDEETDSHGEDDSDDDAFGSYIKRGLGNAHALRIKKANGLLGNAHALRIRKSGLGNSHALRIKKANGGLGNSHALRIRSASLGNAHALRIKKASSSLGNAHALRIKKASSSLGNAHALRIKKDYEGAMDNGMFYDQGMMLAPYIKRQISRAHILRAI